MSDNQRKVSTDFCAVIRKSATLKRPPELEQKTGSGEHLYIEHARKLYFSIISSLRAILNNSFLGSNPSPPDCKSKAALWSLSFPFWNPRHPTRVRITPFQQVPVWNLAEANLVHIATEKMIRLSMAQRQGRQGQHAPFREGCGDFFSRTWDPKRDSKKDNYR